MRATSLSEDPGHGLSFPGFADPARWLAVTSGLARLGIGVAPGPEGGAGLRFQYDFGAGAGFVVARQQVEFEMPVAWDVAFCVRGDSPANTLEIKLVDPAGTSVWRWSRANLDPPSEWTELRIASRDFEFAWGPAGGGSIARTSAIEIAVVAGPGGKGCIDLANFHFIDRSPARGARFEASSEQGGHAAGRVSDADAATGWRSRAGPGPHSLTIAFDDERDLGGLVIDWDPQAMPGAYKIETCDAPDAWTTAFDAAAVPVPSSFVALRAARVRGLRLVATAADAGRGVGVIRIELKPVEWSRTTAEFLTNIAIASRRGAWPRYLLREQTYWTPVSTPRSGPVGLLNDDGAVEIGEGGFLLEPSILLPSPDGAAASGESALPFRWLTWADVERSSQLATGALPVASVLWRAQELTLETTAIAEDHENGDGILVRYRLTNSTAGPLQATLLVAARPLQVTPPWQAFRSLGGPSPIRRIELADDSLVVNGTVRILPLGTRRGFGGARFEDGGLAGELLRGGLPAHRDIDDPAGRAEGVISFDVHLESAASADLFVECRLAARRSALWTACESGEGGGTPAARRGGQDPARRIEAALEDWRAALPGVDLKGSPLAVAAQQGAVTAIGHVLACRDGAALQPGPRRYTRSWIRDGAIMSAALLRAGRADAARAFARWYAPFQREDGFVPCCVDRGGVDPLVEHDSHGQLIYAVAETYRFTRDLAFARELWPRCVKAAAFVEQLRQQRKGAEFQSGERRNCYGLLPESVSHEGYLAQPVHSYWDDFWALRGLRDAAFLARELGLGDDADLWGAAATDLSAAIVESMQAVIEERQLPTVPASVEWADFDPTAIAGAVSLVGAGELFPAEALARTFDEYLRGLRSRYGAAASWNNYSPYEVRIIGALVQLGRREDANELLEAMLGGRRPGAWRQWPEIVWRHEGAPAHLGDLPHCWIGAEYAIALRSMIVFERERDGALVLGAGLTQQWFDAGSCVELTRAPTWYGALDLRIQREGDDSYRITVGGEARPPAGFISALPGSAVIEEKR